MTTKWWREGKKERMEHRKKRKNQPLQAKSACGGQRDSPSFSLDAFDDCNNCKWNENELKGSLLNRRQRPLKRDQLCTCKLLHRLVYGYISLYSNVCVRVTGVKKGKFNDDGNEWKHTYIQSTIYEALWKVLFHQRLTFGKFNQVSLSLFSPLLSRFLQTHPSEWKVCCHCLKSPRNTLVAIDGMVMQRQAPFRLLLDKELESTRTFKWHARRRKGDSERERERERAKALNQFTLNLNGFITGY